MEEELAMLRQIIGQLQELLHNSPPLLPSPFSSSPSFLVLHHPHFQNRLSLPCIEESSVDDCCDIAMAAGKRTWTAKMLESAKRSRKEKKKGDYISGNMDQEIWKEFPQDLFEAVLSRLPIATFFQFRSVCRKWNALIDSDIFSRCCTELSQTEPWFYAVTYQSLYSAQVYDPSLKKWHQPIIIPALAKKKGFMPVASAGGLVCFLEPGHQKIYVSNPLTKSFREVPASFKAWSCLAVGMTLNGNSTSHGYKILWLRCEGDYEVYDSLRMAWTKRGTIPSNIKLPLSLNFMSKPVAIHNTLYFMLTDPGGILSYDMVSGKWKQYIIPIPPHSSDHTLAGCGERLMLVGMLTKNAATCICIWELQKMTLLWKEVDRMPNEWCLDLYGKHIGMRCLGNKGCLILLSLWAKRMNRLVTYNIVTREWTKVLGCTIPVGRKRFGDLGIAYGTAFHPSPTAKA